MRFTRIKSSFSEHRRIPRLGRIRLGLKVQKIRQDGSTVEFPKEVNYFVSPPEVQEVYGPEPTTLDIMLPSDDPEVVFPQSLAWFGSTKGLKCTGNMEVAERLNDKTGEWEKRTCPCEHYKSDENPKGECTESGTLIAILPKVNMGGTYEVRTGSYNSVVDINSGLDYIRALIGRISMVPLKLKRVSRETHADGKKQIHYTLSLILDANIEGVNQLRGDTSRILSSAQLQIEGPSGVNPVLDPVDVTEVDAETIADSSDAELAEIQKKLQEKQESTKKNGGKPAQGDVGRNQASNNMPSQSSRNQDAPAPPKDVKPSTPSTAQAAGGFDLPPEKPKAQRFGTDNIELSEWSKVITYVDMNPDLFTLKQDWKAEHRVENVSKMTQRGQQAFLEYMRKQDPTFPY